MIGRTISHYRVLEKLGEGGMGVVYKAEDTKLKRMVALKFFPVTRNTPGLLREAQIAASLHHQNVCTVFEVNDEEHFIAMEFVDGRTLREKIGERPLRTSEAIGLALQIGEGLCAAHQKGIVHRDVKTGNIMVTTGGQAKVMDFGLARIDNQTSLDGVVVGTPGYMAPEQAEGAPVDQRADIWAFGAVLYEMLTGSRPSPGRLDPLPAGMERIVSKALAINRSDRYQHVDDLLVDLRQAGREGRPVRRRLLIAVGAVLLLLAGGFIGWRAQRSGGRSTGAVTIRSIAVLPLRNMSRDPEQEFFSEGTTEALITSLAQIRSLRVISRTSAMRYKATDKLLSQIAAELGVDGLVEGSIQRSNQRVRVTVQLIHASSDTNLWARSYDRDMSDVLLLQSEVARAIAEEIRATVTADERNRLSRAQSKNPDAQDAFLLGRYHYWKANERDLAEAIRNFDRSIQLDANFAAAYAGLSDAWRQRGVWGAVGFQEVLSRARAAALKALELDPNLAGAHSALASLEKDYDWQWGASEKHYLRALELDPNNLDARWGYALLLMALSRFPEAIREMEHCVAVDPFSPVVHSTYCRILYRARKNPEAKTHCERAIELDPKVFAAHSRLADVYQAMGDFPRALESYRAGFRSRGLEPQEDAQMARIYAAMGRRKDAQRILQKLTSDETAIQANQRVPIAEAFAELDEKDRALYWLEKAFEEKDFLIFTKSEPKFDSLRSDPRFHSLVKRLNIPDRP